MAGRALVLGGGGVTGVAWELGILAGLAEAGVDLTTADLVIGTSAGSVVGAIVSSGEALNEAYERQLAPPTTEKPARIDLGLVLRYASVAFIRDEARARARVGAMAVATSTVTEQERRDVIAARLAGKDWPTTRRLLVTAVAADDGAFVTFGADSEVSLVDAVSASCAVPGVWPPVTIGGRRYIDGGTRSPANVDLASGCDAVVVLAPITIAFRRSMRAAAQLAALPAGTSRVLISPSAPARQAIGRNVLDPARRAAAARAGRAQAATVVQAVRSVWSAS
jgi:NTE family protein